MSKNQIINNCHSVFFNETVVIPFDKVYFTASKALHLHIALFG
jgi:hypothetical protein